MRSTIEIEAQRRGAATAITRIRGGGHFAGRLTGPGEVHLVGTAAGPLGGDDVTITLDVGPGAHLRVRSAAATIVLPGADRPDSRLTIRARVQDGGRLDLTLEPAVVCQGAQHEALLLLELAGDGQAQVREDVVLGRFGEYSGEWTGRTWLTRDGRPELRHALRSRVLGPSVRAIATALTTGGSDGAEPAAAAVHGGAVALPLAAGGVLVTSTAASLITARRDLALCVATGALLPG